MLTLRRDLTRPLTWDELDHNLEVLEIDHWELRGYEEREKCIVVDGSYTTIYNCVLTHLVDVYAPANVFNTYYDATLLWEPISSTYNGQPSNTDIYVTGMTYNGTGYTGNTLTIHQTLNYPDVSVFIPSYALYDHYVQSFYLTGTTLTIHQTGSLTDLTVDLQPIINIATGVTHTDYYVTGATLTGAYHLQLKRNDNITIDVNLDPLRDGNYYTTGATLSGSIATFRKNFGSSYTLDLSALVVTGATSGFSGYSGYSGIMGSNGTSGYSGYSGRSGYSGYSGYGMSGYSGYSGQASAASSGYSGYSGGIGGTGWSGYSGFSGKSGYSGYSGKSGVGVSGYSGFSGVQGLYGASSLILNGDGSCTTDWNYDDIYDPPYYWSSNSAATTVLTAVSGFTDNAWQAVVAADYTLPCGMGETSYLLLAGVNYKLTFEYESSSQLDVTDGAVIYASYAASPSTISGVTLNFKAQENGYLFFGAATGRTLTPLTDWWIIDKVDLHCGNCTGGTGSGLIINNNGDERVLTANGSTTSIDAEECLTFSPGDLNAKANQPNLFQMESYHTGDTPTTLGVISGNTQRFIRGRGTSGAIQAVLDGDIVFQQAFYGAYGTGSSLPMPTVPISRVIVMATSGYNTVNPLLANEYRIQTSIGTPITATPTDRFIIQTDGRVNVPWGFMAGNNVTFYGVQFVTGNTSMSSEFAYIANVGTSPIALFLPAANSCGGQIFYVATNTVGAGGSLLLTPNLGDTIAWAVGIRTITLAHKYILMQSDGISNWLPLSMGL
jgi:hypothetical protein